jgi:hypothetical protein
MPNEYMRLIYSRSESVLNAYCIEKYGSLDSPDNDPETLITDLMADLMHLAMYKELDLDRILRVAAMHFNAEQAEEVEDGADEKTARPKAQNP